MFWQKRAAPTEEEFSSHRTQLQDLSGDLLRKYRANIDTEVRDPARLRAIYGHQFAEGNGAAQAKTVVTMARQMLKVDDAAIHIVLPDGQHTVASATGNDYGSSLDDSYCANVIGTGREFAVNNSHENVLVCDSRMTTDAGIRSYLGVPIANLGGIIIGVLCVWDYVYREWTTTDVGVLTQLSFVLTRATADQSQSSEAT